jgi:hypothetical protein
MANRIKIYLRAFVIICFCSCSDTAIVDGVKVDHTLYENLTISEQKALKDIIQRTLKLDDNALTELVSFECRGAGGCYDLGFVVTQIIYKVGETEFSKMLFRQTEKSVRELNALIGAGFEYGDNDQDGKMDNTTIERVFPALSRQIEARL